MVAIQYKKMLSAYGIFAILFWVSYSFYLPPLTLTLEMESLVSEVHDSGLFSSGSETSKAALSSQFSRSLRIAFFKNLVLIIAGVISGVLIMKKNRWGRVFSITLCSFSLFIWLFKIGATYPNIQETLYATFVLMMQQYPIKVIHLDVVAPLFFITSIVFLTRKSAVKIFE